MPLVELLLARERRVGSTLDRGFRSKQYLLKLFT